MRNTIITLLAAVVAVAVFSHSSVAAVKKSKLGDLRRTDYVVTDVTGGSGGGISNLEEVVAIVTNYDVQVVIPREHQTVLALKPRRLGPYLWEIGSEGEDWNAATNRFAQVYPSYHPGCSGICTSRFHGRNLDWNYDRCASVLVRSTARDGKYASIGLVDGLLPDAVLESGTWTNAYLTLPFSCGDGINEKGVSIQQNVVQRDPEKSAAWRTSRSGCVIAFAIVRYALDRCATALEAADLIRSSLFIPDEFAYDFHYLVSDRTSSYVVEDGHVYSAETCPTDVMTNFRVGSASYNDDRTVKWETVEPYGIGLERYDHIRNASHDMTTVSGILSLMKELWYTRAYNIDTSPYWYTEYCDPTIPELTVMAAKTNQALFAEQRISWYADYLAEHNKATARYRGGKTWQTTHTAVFDRELLTVTLLTQEDPTSLRVFRLVDDRKLTPDDVGALPDDYAKLTNNTRFTSAVASVSPPAVLPEKWALADVTNATGGSVSAKDVSALPDDYTGLKQNTNFSSAVAAVSPKVVLPDKWALAHVTNSTGSSVSADDIGAQTKLPFTTSVGTLVTNYTISVDYASEAGTAGSAYYADEAAVLESPDGLSAIHGDGKWITRTNETADIAVTNTIGTAEAIDIERQRITPISEWKTAVESHLLLANESETTLKTSAYFGDKNNQLVGTIKGEIADWAETGKPEPVQHTVDLNNERTALTIGSRPSPEHTPEWSPALTYSQNDLVKTGNVVYICTVGPSASVQPSSWAEQASFWREVYAGAGSTVFGATNTASGYAAHAEGGVTHADGTFSHAEGIFTRASGLSSHAEGTSTLASGRFSHAEGTSTTAHGLATHAEGSMADARGLATHAEGLATRADGIATHAEGNRAIAIGNFTHAEGAFTLAGSTANTNGTRTSAGYGSAAHAAGYGAVASNQTAFVWQGAGESVEISQEPALTNRYYDHGAGTFNINPVGGLEGIYIGETNLAEHLKYAIPSVKADRIVAEDGLSEILADGTWVTRTNAVTGTVETNRLATQRWVGDAYQPKGNYLTEELDPNVSISGDTVTIHGTSKTFLTSHQSLDNYWKKQDTIPFDKIQYNGEILLESDVRNQLTSTESDKPLSANMGRELKEQIDNIKSRGRFLSLWNSQTGLPYTEPSTSPYVYKTGDYFIVGGIDTSTNYRPSGTNFVSGVPSSSVETNELSVNDTYYFDGTQWSLLHAGQKEVAFSSLTGSPYDNANLSTALTQKRALSDITNAAGRSVSAGDVGAYTKEETETRLTETGTRLTDGTNEIRVDRSVYEKQTAWELSTNTVHASDYDIVDLEVYWNASNTSYGETNVWILIGRAAIIPGGAKSRISSNAISDKNTNAVSFTVRDDIGPNPSVVTAVRGTWRKVGTLALTREIPSSYSWTKVTDRPDSLAGYGITNTVDFSAGNTELVATVDSRVADVVRYETAADGSLTAITAGTRASAETAPEWSASSSYLQGDVVRYGSVLYVCVAGPKETVGPSSWESQSSFWKRAFVGPYSVSIGVTNTVSGIAAQGIGSSVHADGNYAHAEGVFVRADGQASHAEGSSTRASGRFTHAEGISTTAGGLATHAEGSQTEASGVATHAEGLASSARGLATHASGNATTAVGYYTDARGSFTTAGREAGTNAVSSADGGAAAQASGYGAVATNQTAFVWQGVDAETEISQNLNVSRYYDHGAGTFNLNPVGGLSGIYIGETNLAEHLAHAIPAVKADRITTADGLSEIQADGSWVTRTNAMVGVAETNNIATVGYVDGEVGQRISASGTTHVKFPITLKGADTNAYVAFSGDQLTISDFDRDRISIDPQGFTVSYYEEANRVSRSWLDFLTYDSIDQTPMDTHSDMVVSSSGTYKWVTTNFLGKTDASTTYLSKGDASTTYETKTDAGSEYTTLSNQIKAVSNVVEYVRDSTRDKFDLTVYVKGWNLKEVVETTVPLIKGRYAYRVTVDRLAPIKLSVEFSPGTGAGYIMFALSVESWGSVEEAEAATSFTIGDIAEPEFLACAGKTVTKLKTEGMLLTDVQLDGGSVVSGTVAKLNGLASTNYVNDAIAGIVMPTGDRITATNGLSTIYADGSWVTRTNVTAGVVVTNFLCTVAAASAMTNALPNWTKSANKPTYTADDVGALSSDEGVYVGDGSIGVPEHIFTTGGESLPPAITFYGKSWESDLVGTLGNIAWNGKWKYVKNDCEGDREIAVKGDFNDYRLKTDNNLYEAVVTASALTSSTNAPSHTNKQYRVVGKIATVSGEALNHMVCDARTNTAFDCRCLETNLYAVVSPSVSSNYVTKTTTINNKPLSGNVSLTYTDVNALSSGTTHLSGDVPTSRTINGKSLTSNITLQSSDVGAQSEEAAAAMRKSLVNGEVIATRSQTADYYRSGKSGELGYGYAYTVVSGGGTKRLGAYVPDTVFVVEIEASSDNDPLISYYGSDLVQSACARTITALDYDDYDNPGRYSCVTATYTPTNGAPYVLTVANNGGTSTLVGLSASSASWIELYTGGTYHYLYDFYVDSYAMTLSYTDQYYDPDTWQYLTEYRTVHFAIYSGSDLSYEFVVFGNLGTYSTPEDVDTRVGTYIQSHAIQRTVLKERTGKDGELGDGWGYMVYDWTSDMRSWQINIPSLVPSASYTATRLPFYGTAAYGIMYPANPIMDLGFTCGPIVERVKSTHEKFSTTNVRYANAYIQGWGFPGDTGSVETPLIRIDVDNLTHGSASYSSSCKIDGSLTNQVYTYDCAINGTGTYYGNYSNEYHCVMSNFRATNNGLTYDNDVVTKVYRGGALTTVVTNRYYPVCGFTLTRNANSFRSVTTPVEKIATISTAHLFWDPGLKCTWQLAVTNGCFFMEKVSNEDLTRKDQ